MEAEVIFYDNNEALKFVKVYNGAVKRKQNWFHFQEKKVDVGAAHFMIYKLIIDKKLHGRLTDDGLYTTRLKQLALFPDDECLIKK